MLVWNAHVLGRTPTHDRTASQRERAHALVVGAAAEHGVSARALDGAI